jgi:hypothetical protein
MIEKTAAIVTAAVCACFIAGSLPSLAPEVAASAIEQNRHAVSELAKSGPANMWSPTAPAVQMVLDAGRHDRKIACAESWPYYETSCLRDERQTSGNVRNIRIIHTERAAPVPTWQRDH